MRALSIVPGRPGSVRLEEVAEPALEEGGVLVQTLAVGVCGTDRELIEGLYGWAPPGEERLILGHESLGRVLEAPPGAGVARGDLVVAIVRRPDPVPCPNCAAGEWDMCRNGRYTECGIKQRHGFCRERFRVEPGFAVRLEPGLGDVGVLLEPASIVAKAWEHIEKIGARAVWQPRRALVTGAGPVGLLAALMGVQRDLGAHYHTGPVQDISAEADIVIECTGVGKLVFEVMEHNAPDAVVCLTGISSGGRTLGVDAGALNRSMVLENDVVFGSVNANRRHYESAARALAAADRAWLGRVITRRVPLGRWADAIRRRGDDVKVVIDFTL
jgi:threonine dehydrogenase-like Zn-dependent dehydrogenase